MPIDYEKELKLLLEKLIELAQKSFKNYKGQAKKEMEAFYKATKGDLKRWTIELANGQLSREEFENLIKGQKSLLEMKLLQQAGVSLITIQEFRDSAIQLITNTLFNLIP